MVKRKTKRLSALGVKKLSAPGYYPDGDGLYLQVRDGGRKYWYFRFMLNGRAREMGLGPLADGFGLEDARQAASNCRLTIRNNIDPIEARKAAQLQSAGDSARRVTFEAAAREYFAEHIDGKKSVKHTSQWINTFNEYVFPTFGDRRVDSIESSDISRVLAAIWYTKPETARRIYQRIKAVLGWATNDRKYRTGNNPADGLVGKNKALKPRERSSRGHHEALPYDQVSSFLTSMKESSAGEIPKLAFEFLILTAARTSEVLEATWDEVDLGNAVWTIPATRIKAKREHRVPLAKRCIEILKRAKELSGNSVYLFAGRAENAPLSTMVLLMILRRMKLTITAHGFRSTFRVWCAERTNFPTEVCEASLAHSIGDDTVAAYLRTDFFERRRELMNTWALHVTAVPGKVINIREKKKTA